VTAAGQHDVDADDLQHADPERRVKSEVHCAAL
jgi:hypothetical protein